MEKTQQQYAGTGSQEGPAGRRIAVLAVHGVSDQQPDDTAKAIARVLMNVRRGDRPLYSSVEEEPIIVRVNPVQLGDAPYAKDDPKSPYSWYAEAVRKGHDLAGHDEAGHAFLHGQLREPGEQTPHAPYETTRLEGRRRDTQGSLQDAQVHIYEMYWADLSRLGKGAFRVFGELYQILLHLCSVGVHTLRAAVADRPDAAWRNYAETADWACWFLALPIALTNLLLLSIAMSLAILSMLSRLDVDKQTAIGGGLALAGVLAGTAMVCYQGQRHRRLGAFGLVFSLAGIAGLWTVVNKVQVPVVAPLWLNWGLVSAGLVWVYLLLVRKYSRQRPNAVRDGYWVLGLSFGFSLLTVFLHPLYGGLWGDYAPLQLLLRAFDIVYWLNLTAWFFFYGCAFAMGLQAMMLAARAAKLRWFAWFHQTEPVGRAAFTGLICAAGPALLFSVLTSIFWAVISWALLPSLPASLVAYRPMMGDLVTPTLFIGDALGAASVLLPVFMAAGLSAVVVLALGLLPVVLREGSTSLENEPSRRLGGWLTSGYNAAASAFAVIIVAVTLVAPVLSFLRALDLFSVWSPAFVEPLFNVLESFGRDLTSQVGGWITGSAVGIVVLVRTFDALASRFSFIDPILDVDNYLREHPRGMNPTAKIFARYVSMLRFICTWQGPDGQPYDALVIIAHSQGTVITADLLRFLKTESGLVGQGYEPELERLLSGKLPVSLFTMGSPLRQLYSYVFPHMYAYAGHTESANPGMFQRHDLPPDRLPKPGPLGVQCWVNAYRSGDYIGRHLWRVDSAPYLYDRPADPAGTGGSSDWDVNLSPQANVSTDKAGTRKELSLGVGGHTHYWDESAPEVGRELDRLVQDTGRAARQQGA